jgi:hypothetical protein
VKLVERTFRLEAPDGLGRHPRPELIGPLLTTLPETLQDSVRMGFLHSSRARGRISHALKAAADVRFAGMESDGGTVTCLHFRVPRFEDVAPELFAQGKLWDDGPKPEDTAFDLLEAALLDVGARQSDSNHFDQSLLGNLGGYRRLLERGLTSITLGAKSQVGAAHIDQTIVQLANELSAATPESRRVRVAGRLDLMGASQGVLKLHLRPGAIVTALWNGAAPLEQHKELFNCDIVLEGLGVFRPSGTLLRIEADAVAPASAQDDFFRVLPKAPAVHDYATLARLKAGEKSAYAQLLGSVPAEESDEAFEAALTALR